MKIIIISVLLALLMLSCSNSDPKTILILADQKIIQELGYSICLLEDQLAEQDMDLVYKLKIK